MNNPTLMVTFIEFLKSWLALKWGRSQSNIKNFIRSLIKLMRHRNTDIIVTRKTDFSISSFFDMTTDLKFLITVFKVS
jgi:hypothetical protein